MERGRIGGTGEALAAAATPRRQRPSSASWRHRAQRYGFHCRRKVRLNKEKIDLHRQIRTLHLDGD